ncbi:MAG: OmpA family protein [Gemmatimonadota bacterium]
MSAYPAANNLTPEQQELLRGRYQGTAPDTFPVIAAPSAAPVLTDTATALTPLDSAEIAAVLDANAIGAAFTTSGRVAFRAIYFPTASSEARIESQQQLTEVANYLKANPTLTVSLEGHTDSVGDAAANLLLSQQRATDVRDRLIRDYAVPAAQIINVGGFGSTVPAASNSTPEGRRQNRRVEMVRATPARTPAPPSGSKP